MFANNTQLHKEVTLPTKSELGQKLARERIEKRVKGFKSDLQLEMRQDQVGKLSRKSPKVYRSSVPLSIYSEGPATPASHPRDISETSPYTPRIRREKIGLNSSNRVHLELSPTGFVHFPRHRDDDDWERVSVRSVPIEE
jgi:hypothetical protein